MAPSDRRSVPSSSTTAAQRNAGPVPFRRNVAQRRTTGFSQADTRRGVIMHDQHGRQWSAQIENKSGMPTGLITNDFEAPWLPSQVDLVVNPENPSALWIDYRAMFTRRQQALNEYHDLAVQLCVDKSWPVPKKGKYSSDIRRILKRAPQPLQPVIAAMQENPWILGFTDVEDPRLVEFVRDYRVVTPEEMHEEDFGPESYGDLVHTHGGDAVAAGDDDDDLDEDLEEGRGPHLGDFTGDPTPELAAAGDDDDLDDLDDDLLDELTSEADKDALAGRAIPPAAAPRAPRQAPRRPAQTSKTVKKGASRGSAKNSQARRRPASDKRRSLADGAAPAVSSGGLDD